MKKEAYYSVAERMYVAEQCTIERITQEIPVAEKTVRNWKKEGNWDAKRQELLKTKQTFHTELYDFARKLMKSISVDLDNPNVDVQGRLNAMTRLLDKLNKTKEYEDAMKVEKQAELTEEQRQDGLSDEAVQKIEKKLKIM